MAESFELLDWVDDLEPDHDYFHIEPGLQRGIRRDDDADTRASGRVVGVHR